MHATAGNDSNNGRSPDSPWRTLDKVNAFNFSPGDRILLRAGQVWNGQLLINNSGTNGNPIIVNRYGSGNKPILNGGGLLTNSAATVLLKNSEYLEINNLEITNTNGATNYQGDLWGILSQLDIEGGMEANHIYIRDCFIHDVNGNVATKETGGIYMTAFSEAPSRYNNLKIENNVIDRVGGLGIANQSAHASISRSDRYPSINMEIRGNRISNTGRNNMIVRASDGSIVEYNTLINTSRYDSGHSVFCFNTDGIIMQYNEAYGNVGSGDKDRGAYDADYNCRNTIIQYNYSHDNFWGFAIMKRAVNENVTIRYNISENDQRAIYFYGFEGRSGLTTANFYNNTHYVRSGIQLTVFGSGGFARTAIKTNYYNNIFYFEDPGSSWGSFSSSSVNFQNNSFYNIEPQGTNFITSNPRLVAPNTGGQDIDWDDYPNVLTGYKLRSDSPCINAGRVIPDNGGQDFHGEPLYNGAPDIGASEYAGDTGSTGGGTEPPLSGDETIIPVMDDTFVRGGSSSGTTFGNNSLIRVKQSSNDQYSRHGLLRFDLNSLTAASSARLYIYGYADDQMDVAVYKINNDNWNEDSVTWNNVPAFSTNVGSLAVQATNQWYSIDITSLVTGEIANGGTLSIGLRDDTDTGLTANFFSKENTQSGLRAFIAIDGTADNQTTAISAQADALVRDGSHANSNFGSLTNLEAKRASTGFSRLSYLRFNIASLGNGNITRARLVLEPSLAGSNASSTQIEVRAVSDDSWSESGITWNNRPGRDAVLDSQQGSGSTMEWDVTSQVQQELAGDGVISLALSSTITGGEHFVRYHSRESASKKLTPTLVVEFSGPSGPPISPDATVTSVIDDAFVRGGSSSGANFGSNSLIRVKESSNNQYTRHGLLRFDVNSLSSATSATLYVYGSAQQQMDIAVYKINNDNWQEESVTWNNAPSFSTYQGDLSVQTTDQWYGIDVTSLVQGEIANGGTLSIGLRDDNTTGITADFFSKENNGGNFGAFIAVEGDSNGSSTSLSAEADALLRDGSHANTNFGSLTNLEAKRANTGFSRMSYLRFNVSSLSNASNISSARLVLEPVLAGSNASSTQIEVRAVSDDSWSESGITWNNRPGRGAVLDSQQGSGSTMEWDVTSQVQQEVAGDGTISLALFSSTAGGEHFVRFHSRESASASLRPSLLITTNGGGSSSLRFDILDGFADLESDEDTTPDEIGLELYVYPNPVSDILYIQNLANDGTIKQIDVTNINGNVVERNVDIQNIEKSGLNVAHLTPGIYIVRCYKNNGEVINNKVIVR